MQHRHRHKSPSAWRAWLTATLAGVCVMSLVSLTLAQMRAGGGGGGGGGRGGGPATGPVGQAPSLRYGGQNQFQPKSRLLPSEARGVHMQAGMLPSERRDARYGRGSLRSEGLAPAVSTSASLRYPTYSTARTQVTGGYQTTPSLRYQNAQTRPAKAQRPQEASTELAGYRAPTGPSHRPQQINGAVRWGKPVNYRY